MYGCTFALLFFAARHYVFAGMNTNIFIMFKMFGIAKK